VSRPRIAVLAQDLVWSDRLARSVDAAGAEPARAKTLPEFDRAPDCADHAIVDLTARAYDPIEAIGRARAHGAQVLAVGPHDDAALRERAFAAGADRVLAYRKLFEDGPATVQRWLERGAAAPSSGAPSPGTAAASAG
jgi:DNA-binding NarL/FixJ family response regulator